MTIIVAGAGLAGLSAASYLQKYGLKPHIFEASCQVADFPTRAEVVLPVMSKPVSNPLNWLKRKHDLNLRALGPIQRIIFHSRQTRAVITGTLGSIVLRGSDPDSLDRQLAAHLLQPIHFERHVSVSELKSPGAKIIWATGQTLGTAGGRTLVFKGGLLAGRFEPATVHIWRTLRDTSGGYAYLVPMSETHACAFVIFTKPLNPDKAWQRFWPRMSRDLGFEPQLLRADEFHQRVAPFCPYPAQSNILQVGNAFGSVMPLLGLDIFSAALTGIWGAKAVTGRADYLQATGSLRARLHRMQIINQVMAAWGDSSFDILVGMMNFGGTPFFNSRLDLMRPVSTMVCPLAKS